MLEDKDFDKSDGDYLSTTTASSSGMQDCDITILGHDCVRSLIGKVEKELLQKRYTMSRDIPAGRLKQENLISRVKHAEFTIIILKKENSKAYQAFLAVLPPPPHQGALDASKTLILYEDGLKRIRPIYKNNIRLLMSEGPTQIATQISGFVKARKLYQSHEISFREFYANLLIHSIINPRRSEMRLKIDVQELQETFNHKYGCFCHLVDDDLTQNLANYLTKSSDFYFKRGVVYQTENGALQTHIWFHEVENPIKVKPHKNVTTSSSSTNEHSLEENERTQKWVGLLGSELPNENVPSETTIIDWTITDPLRKLLPEFDSRYSFFLISRTLISSSFSQEISNIPWLKVFDFDIDSRNNGLLSSVESLLENHTISTCKESSKPLMHDKVDWFFPLGFSSQSDTLFNGSPLHWFTTFKDSLEKECSAVANFCSLCTMPVFVILWYDDDDIYISCLDRFLSILYPAFKSDTLQKRFILCTDEKSYQNASLQNFIKYYELSESTMCTDPDVVFKYFGFVQVPERLLNNSFRLPKAKDDEDDLDIVEISKDYVWIKDFIEVLSLESQDEIAQRTTENLGCNFVMGSTITWDELAANTIAVQRQARKNVSDFLKKEILKDHKSVVIKILHAPGGGGTTFARQLLWDLHTKVPCGVVVPNLTLSVTQIKDSVRFLHEKTLLPVVLLVDGRSINEVEQLYESNKYAIVILHVQRSNADISDTKFNPSTRTCLLPGKVSPTEAENLTKVFSKFAPQSENALSALTDDVNKRKKTRFVFEYGLTAFNHKFKGVRKYVHGYLKMETHTDRIKNLHNWQKVVAYLSLVLYYGQSGLHRETFHNLLKKGQKNDFVTLEDMEYTGRQFILETRGVWKISYNVVAKEILEQVLAPSIDLELSGNKDLTPEALCNLHELVIDFIAMIRNAVKGSQPETLTKILTEMILRRDYIDMDVKDGYSKRFSLSRLLEQIPVKDNRVEILRQLTYTFPKHTEFHAHLGRLLNIMERFEEAEKSLRTALDIRKSEKVEVDPLMTDDVRGRIHHMFGNCYLRQAKIELRSLVSMLASHSASPSKMINMVKKAVQHFSSGRRYATRNLSFGYIGEVRARLLIAEYVDKKFQDGCKRAFFNKLGKQQEEISELVREAHSVCDQLLAECRQQTLDIELRRIYDYGVSIETFNTCFGNIRGNMNLWNKTEGETNIPLCRSQIASLKMNYNRHGSRPKHFLSIDNVTEKKDIEEIIHLYERACHEAFSSPSKYIFVSVDMREWLDAIRHDLTDDTYTLNKVLQYIDEWVRRNEDGLATFYAYVINFVLSIFGPGQDQSALYNSGAIDLKKRMQSQRFRNFASHWKFEWLAKHQNLTVRKLVSSNKLGVWEKDKRFWKDAEGVNKLHVCTGTVVKSSSPLNGIISVDVPWVKKFGNRVEIYFVPKLYDLYGVRHAEKRLRVEFCIGFSPEHGAEAFLIKRIEKKFCKYCEKLTETLTINGGSKGRCAECNNKKD